MGRKFRRNYSDGGSMLASIIVIVLGAVLCSWIVLVSGDALQDWMIAFIVVGAILLVFGLLWYRYRRASGSNLSFWKAAFSNHYDDGLAANYRPRKVHDSRHTGGPRENRPINAAELRDIRETSPNTWVPAGPTKSANDPDSRR